MASFIFWTLVSLAGTAWGWMYLPLGPHDVVTWQALALAILVFAAGTQAGIALDRWHARGELGSVYDRNGLRRRKD